jgi:AraC family transcriptional regulator of adaptative response / DNA-3-methyladenine glycosylase II
VTLGEVGFAAGFASLRQFNATVRQVYGMPPTGLREAASGRGQVATPGTLGVRLAYRPPLDTTALFGFLAEPAVTGIEDGDGGFYRRSLDLPYGSAVVTLRAGAGEEHVYCELRLEDLRDLPAAVQRCRRVLDLDADPDEITSVLGEDPLLAPLVAAHPGRRVPGHVDAAEFALRAVLGRQVASETARTLTARLVEQYGRPLGEPVGTVTHSFPRMDVLAAADPADLAMPRAGARAVVELAGQLAAGVIRLDTGADRNEAERQLLAVTGIGPRPVQDGAHGRRPGGDPRPCPPSELDTANALESVSYAFSGMSATRSPES